MPVSWISSVAAAAALALSTLFPTCHALAPSLTVRRMGESPTMTSRSTTSTQLGMFDFLKPPQDPPEEPEPTEEPPRATAVSDDPVEKIFSFFFGQENLVSTHGMRTSDLLAFFPSTSFFFLPKNFSFSKAQG